LAGRLIWSAAFPAPETIESGRTVNVIATVSGRKSRPVARSFFERLASSVMRVPGHPGLWWRRV